MPNIKTRCSNVMSMTQELTRRSKIDANTGDFAEKDMCKTKGTECSLAWSSAMQLFAFSRKQYL